MQKNISLAKFLFIFFINYQQREINIRYKGEKRLES